LAILQIMPGQIEGWNIFARRRVSVIHRQVIRLWRRAKRGWRKIVGLPFAVEPWNEWNDFRAHANASHTAIAIRPARESDIRVAVMLASS
jgi:hypothetical protein